MNEQKKQNQQVGLKLPQIQPLENKNQDEQKQGQQQLSNTDNLQPLTHQKKKKKFHKRKVRKHSPEYYEKKKQTKLNKLKQKNWDSHFINDIIPEFMIKNKNKPKRTLSRLDEKRQSIDVVNPISNKTLNSHKKDTLSQADKIIDKNKKAKSFNIRVVNNQTQSTNQNGQSNKNIKTQKQVIQKVKPNAKTQKNKVRKKSTIKIEDDQQMIKQKNIYHENINVLFQETKFINCHKQVLQIFVTGLNKKNTYEIIDKQLVKLKGKTSQIFKITESIEKRQSQFEKVKSQAKQKNDLTKVSYQVIDNFRTSTLACIEQILKWKQKWQNTYSQIFLKQISFDLVYKVQNYLLTILKSADQLLVNDQSQQKNTQVPNQQKKQKNKNIQVKNKDPFLISIFGLEKESKQIILKIRACQLLLLQEQYNSKNK